MDRVESSTPSVLTPTIRVPFLAGVLISSETTR
jgi:hypothetical protein